MTNDKYEKALTGSKEDALTLKPEDIPDGVIDWLHKSNVGTPLEGDTKQEIRELICISMKLRALGLSERCAKEAWPLYKIMYEIEKGTTENAT